MIKNNFLIFTITFAGFIVSSGIETAKAQCYEILWADEFNYTGSPDTAYWTSTIGGGGFGNNELQYYTGRKENVYVDSGFLTITARKEAYAEREYTSAKINTRKKVSTKYGKIEARIRTPYGQGIWPAFWMLGSVYGEINWPACGEIDILELIGGGEGRDDVVHGTIHWENNGHNQKGGSKQLSSGIFADDFHTFSLEWNPKVMIWYLDGLPYYSTDIQAPHQSEFHDDFYIILNLAVGGDWPGYPDETTVFPQKMEVDYVRIYKKSEEVDSLEISGNSTVAENASKEIYSLPYSRNWHYSWIIPEGTQLIDGEDTNEITVNWSCNTDTIHCDLLGRCKVYSFSKVIRTGQEISGPKFVKDNEEVIIFTVPSAHETSYHWSVPDDADIISGENNDTLIVNWGSTFTSVSVEINNACGTSILESDVIRYGQYAYPDIYTPHRIPGSIRAVDYDYGGQGAAYHDSSTGNSGDGPRQDENVDTEYKDNGEASVGFIEKGEYLEYTIHVDSSAYYDVSVRVATANSSAGPISLRFNYETLLDDILISNTGGWDQFKTVDIGNIFLTPEDTVLRVSFRQGGINFSEIVFASIPKSDAIDANEITRLTILPVPAREYIEIQGLQNVSSVEIFDINGKNLQQKLFLQPQYARINVASFPMGMYYIKISNNAGKTWNKKFIKM